MELIHSSSSQKVERSVNIADGPIVSVYIADSTSARYRSVRINHVTVSYILRGDWDVYQLRAGGVIRHNGKDTKGTYQGEPPPSWAQSEEWKFMQKIIDMLRPQGAADLPFDSRALQES